MQQVKQKQNIKYIPNYLRVSVKQRQEIKRAICVKTKDGHQTEINNNIIQPSQKSFLHKFFLKCILKVIIIINVIIKLSINMQ